MDDLQTVHKPYIDECKRKAKEAEELQKNSKYWQEDNL